MRVKDIVNTATDGKVMKGVKSMKTTPPTILDRLVNIEDNIVRRITEIERIILLHSRDIDAIGARQGVTEMHMHSHNEA